MEDEEDETVQEKSFAEDERVQFLGRCLAHLLRLKEDKWCKFLEEEQNQKLVADFLESNRPAFLAFYLSVAGGLAMETKIPSVIKHKLVWVMKSANCIGTENYKEDLRLSELSGIPLEHVIVFLEKVAVPLLSSKKNNGSWPHVISQDMAQHIEIMKNKTYVMNGIVTGKILLPLPTIATKTDFQDMCTENKQNSQIRFDMFLNRLEKIENIFVTMLEFEKLEKLEFGGIKGKCLNAQICKLNEEFIESCNTFKEKTYDPLDYNNTEFEEDYADFKHKNLEFERRLGAIFCVGFLDCSGLESAFKLITILGSFLEKPIITEMFSTNYKMLLQMFDEELRNCKYLYDEHIKQKEEGNEVINKNMPSTSGNLKWSREIKSRILSFWSSFSFVPHHVNFDPKLIAVLRDVKYLLLMDQPNIPISALELYKKKGTFAKYTGNLELVVQWYNKIKQTVLEELPEKWNSTKKLAVSIKHEVAPLLTSEVTILRKKCTAFDGKQIGFRERFRADAPFRFDAQNPYALLDKANQELERMEEEMLHLQESANLFEVTIPEYKQIKQCRKEIKLLKGMWDINISVTSSIDDWTKRHWREISMEQMETELRRFAKAKLQNPAIRDRHWYQLMEAIGVQFSITEDTTLANLLALNLHNVEDDVRNIVDKAMTSENSFLKIQRDLIALMWILRD
ncbi:dynein heavy chain 11 axonemal [Crotalus adamanteus]|uniref:Dynein heavy chain 11 axonemal n=1 Tax=Crotalus adamanteus TaxID=8729 RepID=A0AAW1B3S8_CROAD